MIDVLTVSWAAGGCFAVLVLLVLAKVGAGELLPAGPGVRRLLRGLDIASAVTVVLLVSLLAVRILLEIG